MSRNDDKCYGSLDAASQLQAAEAHAAGELDLLDGELRCECGATVGARRVPKYLYRSDCSDADYEANPRFHPYPRPHQRFKEPRQPARKRDGGKRSDR